MVGGRGGRESPRTLFLLIKHNACGRFFVRKDVRGDVRASWARVFVYTVYMCYVKCFQHADPFSPHTFHVGATPHHYAKRTTGRFSYAPRPHPQPPTPTLVSTHAYRDTYTFHIYDATTTYDTYLSTGLRRRDIETYLNLLSLLARALASTSSARGGGVVALALSLRLAKRRPSSRTQSAI